MSELDVNADVLRLAVVDDGVGIDGSQAGVGMVSMRQRADDLGGQLDIVQNDNRRHRSHSHASPQAPAGHGGISMNTRVLMADDHPTFVRTLTAVLRSADVDVIASASNGEDAVSRVLERQLDVALMDIHMPGIDGIEATARITDAAPHVAVVVLTMFDDDDSVFAAMQAGARGYLVKGAPKDEILRSVDAAARGEAIFGAAIARRLRSFFPTRPVSEKIVSFPGAALTSRERDVPRSTRGCNNAEIARRGRPSLRADRP